jgi:hypothetical protein
MIKIEDCKDGFLYRIDARNARVGIYDKEQLGFIISRHKFKDNFLYIEYHWDVGNFKPELKQHGTVVPLEELGPTKLSFPPEMNDEEKLKFLNQQEEKLGPMSDKEVQEYLERMRSYYKDTQGDIYE